MISTLAVAAFAVGCGYIVKGLTGFGSALVAIPLLSMVLPPADAIVLATSVDMFVGGGLALSARHDVPWKATLTLLATMLPLQVVGTWLHGQLPEEAMRRGIGLAVVAVALWWWWRTYRPDGALEARPLTSASYAEALGAGALAGVLSGTVGMPGPAIVTWSLRWLGPKEARANMLAVFAPASMFLVAGYVGSGLVSPELFMNAVLVLPVAMGGAWVGSRLAKIVSPMVFARVVAVVLFVAGAMLGLR